MNPEEKVKQQAWKNERDLGGTQRNINEAQRKIDERNNGDPLLKVGDLATGLAYKRSLNEELDGAKEKKDALININHIREGTGPYKNFSPEQRRLLEKTEGKSMNDNEKQANQLANKLADMASEKAKTGAKAARVVQDINAYAGTVAVTAMR